MKKKIEKLTTPPPPLEVEVALDATQLARVRDVPEPGTEPLARLPEAEARVLGFDTFHMARGYLSQLRDGDKYRIVRVDDTNNDQRVLAYFLQECPSDE